MSSSGKNSTRTRCEILLLIFPSGVLNINSYSNIIVILILVIALCVAAAAHCTRAVYLVIHRCSDVCLKENLNASKHVNLLRTHTVGGGGRLSKRLGMCT